MASCSVSRELGFDTDYFQVHIRPVRISQESMAIMQASWHAAGHPDSAWGVVLCSFRNRLFLGRLRLRFRRGNADILAHRTEALQQAVNLTVMKSV